MVVYTLEQRWEVDLRSTYRICRFRQNKKISFSDEAYFALGGYVNKQNCPIWSTDPHAYIEKPRHPKRVTVWCGFWSRGITGPFSKKEGIWWTLYLKVFHQAMVVFYTNTMGLENTGGIKTRVNKGTNLVKTFKL